MLATFPLSHPLTGCGLQLFLRHSNNKDQGDYVGQQEQQSLEFFWWWSSNIGVMHQLQTNIQTNFENAPFSSPEPTILLACGRNRELWEQPFRACAVDEDRVKPDGQNSVISFVISKRLLPELSIPAAGQKDRRLWGREWECTHCTCLMRLTYHKREETYFQTDMISWKHITGRWRNTVKTPIVMQLHLKGGMTSTGFEIKHPFLFSSRAYYRPFA